MIGVMITPPHELPQDKSHQLFTDVKNIMHLINKKSLGFIPAISLMFEFLMFELDGCEYKAFD